MEIGAGSSTSVLTHQLVKLLEENGTRIKSQTAKESVKILEQASPWFLISAGLNIPNREQVKTDLQKGLHDKGPDQIPIATFSLWKLAKDALLSEKVEGKEQSAEVENVLRGSRRKNPQVSKDFRSLYLRHPSGYR